MLTKNNWLTSNIRERISNKSIDFNVIINRYEFSNLNFLDACKESCLEISDKYNDFYISLSGGMDSEFIVRQFHSLNIPFKVIIVKYTNPEEIKYAFSLCEELSIDPVIISLSDEEFLDIYIRGIIKKINGVGINASQMIAAARYVENCNGTLVTGINSMLDGNKVLEISREFVCFAEWDFYTEILCPNLRVVSPMIYTPTVIIGALLETHFMPDNITWQYFRSKLYGIEFRQKLYSNHRKSINQLNYKTSLDKTQNFMMKSWNAIDAYKLLKG